MPKHDQRANRTKDNDNKAKSKHKPDLALSQHPDQVALSQVTNGTLSSISNGSVQDQTAHLQNPQVLQAQRQAIAKQMAHWGGNQYLQTVMLQMKRQELEATPSPPQPAPGNKHLGLSARSSHDNTLLLGEQPSDDLSNRIQRLCGVDESCPEGMEYASTWDGTEPTSSHDPGLSASGTLSYGYSRGEQTTVGVDNDTYFRDSSSYTAGASFNPNEGHLGVSGAYSRSTEVGDATNTRSVGGSGYLDFNARGELESGGGSFTASADGTSVNIGGGMVVSAQPPRLNTDGRYVVTWKRQYTGTVGGGHTTEGGVGGKSCLSRPGINNRHANI